MYWLLAQHRAITNSLLVLHLAPIQWITDSNSMRMNHGLERMVEVKGCAFKNRELRKFHFWIFSKMMILEKVISQFIQIHSPQRCLSKQIYSFSI